jgi:hypothetical protein
MDNVFAYKHDKNNSEPVFDGEVFITDRISEEAQQLLDESNELLDETQKKYSLPTWLSIIRFIAYIVSLIVVVGIISSLSKVSLSTAYNNAPFLFYAGIISVIISIVLFIISKKKDNDFVKSEENEVLNQQGNTIINNAKKAFNIPEDSKKIEILSYRYVEKNGEKKVKSFGSFSHLNISMTAYIKDGFLCMADVATVWSFPLTSITDFIKVEKRINFPIWNKSEPFNSEKYKTYKIRTNQFGTFFAFYYLLKINDTKGQFEIMIPIYDAEELGRLIGYNVVI